MEPGTWILSGVIGVASLWFLNRIVPWIREIHLTIQAASKLPARPGHWLWGNLGQFHDAESLADVQYEMAMQGYRAFVVWFTSIKPVIYLNHPDTIKLLLKTAEPKPSRFGGGYQLLNGWIGDGILISSGPKWERNRKLLTPAFHFDILKPYVQIYNKAVDVFMDKVAQTPHMEIYSHVSLLTLDVVLQCALTYDNDVQQRGDKHPYVEAVHRAGELIIQRGMRPWFYNDFVFYRTAMGKEFKSLCDYMHSVADSIIQNRKETLKMNPDALKRKRHLDFLDILLTARDEDGLGLPDREIRDEVDTFMFAGHDTTASAISWAIFALAKYPEEQEKVRQEVCDVIGNKQEVEWEDIGKLKYIPIFIKEVLRYFSVVYQVVRQTTEPVTIEGVVIPPGVMVSINIKDMNHNPDVWPDHNEFRPHRFDSEAFIQRDPYVFVPFSAGPRNCIGQNFALNEIKVALCRIVQRYEISLDEDYPEAQPYPLIVIRPKAGIHLVFTKRE